MQTFRVAFRSLRSTPMLTLAAVLSLALGIGATTAIFTMLNGLLLKPLPVRDPGTLVVLADASRPGEPARLSYPMWKALQERQALPRWFATAGDRVTMTSGGASASADVIWASGGMFDILGLQPVLGRPLRPDDDRPDGGVDGPVAMISHACWQQRFGGDAGVTGRSLTIARVVFRIVGVTPAEFHGLTVGDTFDVILPLQAEPLLGRTPRRLESPTWTWLEAMGRRQPGETIASLTNAMRRAQPQIRTALMPDYPREEDRAQFMAKAWQVQPAPGGLSRLRRQYSQALVILLGLVICVLLMACTNIAGLLLARARARGAEFSVKRALGASWRRILAQQLVEALLVAGTGAAIGLWLAAFGSRMLVAQLSTWAARAVLDLSLDWRVAAVAAAVTIATTLLCGAAPAFSAMRAKPLAALRPAPRGASGNHRLAGTFILAQVALSTVLLVGAGLFLRSFVALAYRDIGLDRDRVLVAVLDPPSGVPAAQRQALLERVRDAVAATPGVEAAALSMATPVGSAGIRMTPAITVPGKLPAEGSRLLTNPVGPGWFQTYGTRLLAGRDFDATDRQGAPAVIIVNEAFAARYLPAGNPIGQTIVNVGSGTERVPLTVVGVVENAAFTSVRDPLAPTLYAPMAQWAGERLLASAPVSLSVRTAGRASPAVVPAVRGAIARVEPRLDVSVLTLREQVDPFYLRERLLATLSMFFGAFALIIAAVGLYGLTFQAVTWRRGEIGIRLALGALPRSVQWLIAGDVGRVVGAGLIAGSLLSLWAARFIGTLLYSVDGHDVRTFAAAITLLMATTGIASWWPTRRVSRLDPSLVLRDQ